MDKNSHQRPIVIGPTNTHTHTRGESCVLSLSRSNCIGDAEVQRRRANNNGNCVPTVRKSMCSRARLALFLSLAPYFELPCPTGMGSLNRITRSTAERELPGFWLYWAPLLNTPLNGRTTITDIKEPMEQSHWNNGPQNEREKTLCVSESATTAQLSPR